MRDTYEAEEMILAMAQIVNENRALREENKKLRLKEKEYDAILKNMTDKAAQIGNKEHRIARFKTGGYTTIHLFGDYYLVRNYSKFYTKFSFYGICKITDEEREN